MKDFHLTFPKPGAPGVYQAVDQTGSHLLYPPPY